MEEAGYYRERQVREIRFHGRGGQGAVVASTILAEAAFIEGSQVQAFPFFGVERRGAPVTAYARIAKKKIRIRSAIYEPDYIVVLDPTLIGVVDVAKGVRSGGMVLVNTNKSPKDFKFRKDVKVVTVDATSIAKRHGLGTRMTPIVNTPMLGALARIIEEVSLDSIIASIKKKIIIKTDENVKAAMEASNLVTSNR